MQFMSISKYILDLYIVSHERRNLHPWNRLLLQAARLERVLLAILSPLGGSVGISDCPIDCQSAAQCAMDQHVLLQRGDT
jgi:hypothetical protein